MFNILLIFTLIILICSILIIFPKILRFKPFSQIQKNLSFECGINILSSSRSPFSLRFFLLIVIFIIFDVEIALILAIPILYTSSILLNMITIFILILLIGTIYEWYEGSLIWK